METNALNINIEVRAPYLEKYRFLFTISYMMIMMMMIIIMIMIMIIIIILRCILYGFLKLALPGVMNLS